MKRHSELYAQIFDFANIESAYRKARRCKRYRNEVLRYTENLEENLINLQNHFIWHTYKQGQRRIFTVTEPKKRTISALPFKDRVAHHAVNNIIEPLIDKRFYYHSYACRKGKGMHAASDTLSRWIRNLSYNGKPVYALKCDIRQYFQSIDHKRLKAALRRIIKDEEVLWLLDLIIDEGSAGGRGIPVGNLTSQLFANVYLDALDKYVKETLRVKYYMRYMDDFIILSHSKTELAALWRAIEAFLHYKLDLQLNPKTGIVAAKNGIDFCGYRHWKDHKKVRRRSVRRMKNTIKAYNGDRIPPLRFEAILKSWLGHIQHADTYHLRERMLQRIRK